MPAEFKAKLVVDLDTPLDDRDIWINAFSAMYKITEEDLSYIWGEVTFQLPPVDVKVFVKIPPNPKGSSQLSGQYLVWGLNYIATSLAVTKRSYALTTTLTWKGEEVGSIHIGESAPGETQSAVSISATNVTGVLQLPSGSNPLPPRPDSELEINLVYGLRPLDRTVAFQTAIKAIGDAAEAGLDNSAVAIATSGVSRCRWYLLGGHGPTLRFRYSREAVKQTMARMVSDNQFRQMFVFLKWRGQHLSEGALEIAH